MNKTEIEILILRLAEVSIGNAFLGERSLRRREGANRSRRIIKDLIAERMDACLAALRSTKTGEGK